MNDAINAVVAPLRANVLAWYSGRQPNEQRLLRIAAIVVPVLIVLVLLSSLQTAVTRLDKRVATKRSDLAYQQSVAPVLASAPRPAASNQSLVAIIDAGSREAGLAVIGTDPVGPNQLRVRLENAPFDTLVGWLIRLQQTQGIAVQNASIDRGAAPGQVNATLTLARP